MSLATSLRRGVIALASAALAACSAASGAQPVAFPGAAGSRPATRETSNLPAKSPSAVPVGTAAVGPILDSARSLVGTPYRFGGASPTEGFDCSGLVAYVAQLHGVALPRTVIDQFASGRPVDRSHLVPGDLVFYSTIGPGATHVGIVVESTGAPHFIHAPADGSTVRVERMDTSYWEQRWVGARRVF
jgi:cell wall-associated NlpC family hydrolase